MLLGCCHCGEPHSESLVFTSQSVSLSPSSESLDYDSYDCNEVCSGDRRPLRYELFVPRPAPPLGSGICLNKYYGRFILYLVPNSCIRYTSAERASINEVGCPEVATEPRWVLRMSSIIPGYTWFSLQGQLQVGGFMTAIVTYRAPDGLGNFNPPPNCLDAFTLFRQSPHELGYNLPDTCNIRPI